MFKKKEYHTSDNYNIISPDKKSIFIGEKKLMIDKLKFIIDLNRESSSYISQQFINFINSSNHYFWKKRYEVMIYMIFIKKVNIKIIIFLFIKIKKYLKRN